MTVGAAPLTRINGPLPQEPLYTLLKAARVPGPELDREGVDRFGNGATVHSYSPDVPVAWNPCSTGTSRPKDDGGEIPLPDFGAFGLYLPETCTAMSVFGASGDPVEEFRARARAVFAATESFGVERELQAGDFLGADGSPFFANGNGSFPNLDAATSPVNGIALLENAIAASGRQGMIHISPALAVVLGSHVLARDDRAGVLRTINGTVVVPGDGYAQGADPTGHAAASDDQEWAYASGPVEVRRSEVFVVPDELTEALDREQNEITYRAERWYLAIWDTAVQAAVLIDRCQTTC